MKWTGPDAFEIDGTNFRLSYTPGGEGLRSTDNEFIIAKDPSFLERYIKLQYGGFKKILELGVFEGGSFVFLDKLLRPDRLSAIEWSDRPKAALEAYIAKNAPRTKLHCPVSQADPAALDYIVENDFGGEVDLVVDDASHWYDYTKISLLNLYPKLRPGGLYIIEDWAWNFHSQFQGENAPWSDQKALTNLIIELLEEISVNNSIVDMTVTSDMVIIRKPLLPARSALLSVQARRGRQMPDL